jgi:RimJ/RimL family protein N-acetyltransferase
MNILETDRLVLGSWQASDWLELRPIATDPEVMRYITGGVPWTDEQIQWFVKRQIELYSERGHCRWKLLAKGADAMLGFCGVGLWHDAPEIGWWLARQHWGRGFATEAARVALQDLFDRVRLDRVISIVRPANTASIRVMEKLGLSLECELQNEGVPVRKYVACRPTFV